MLCNLALMQFCTEKMGNIYPKLMPLRSLTKQLNIDASKYTDLNITYNVFYYNLVSIFLNLIIITFNEIFGFKV